MMLSGEEDFIIWIGWGWLWGWAKSMPACALPDGYAENDDDCDDEDLL